ncbi:MAG: hypothetical protein KME35_17585, partial [Aphanocapsa sp. GSE-SYN-MK-11-07L]|nr:hypothetical protein [Aphanocapsa sp. GSE-SYN-MK-11-07L]
GEAQSSRCGCGIDLSWLLVWVWRFKLTMTHPFRNFHSCNNADRRSGCGSVYDRLRKLLLLQPHSVVTVRQL